VHDEDVGVRRVLRELVPRLLRQTEHHLGIDQVLRAAEGDQSNFHVLPGSPPRRTLRTLRTLRKVCRVCPPCPPCPPWWRVTNIMDTTCTTSLDTGSLHAGDRACRSTTRRA